MQKHHVISGPACSNGGAVVLGCPPLANGWPSMAESAWVNLRCSTGINTLRLSIPALSKCVPPLVSSINTLSHCHSALYVSSLSLERVFHFGYCLRFESLTILLSSAPLRRPYLHHLLIPQLSRPLSIVTIVVFTHLLCLFRVGIAHSIFWRVIEPYTVCRG